MNSGNTPASLSGVTPLGLAGVASLGAGAVHAAAVGAHSGHQQVVVTFALLSAFQLAWGAAALALSSARRWFLAVGAVGNLVAVVGWVLAKDTGISLISGLEKPEAIQLADATAAGLALVACLMLSRLLLVPDLSSSRLGRRVMTLAVVPILGLAVASMISVGSHSHSGGHGDHGSGSEVAAAGHDHGAGSGSGAGADGSGADGSGGGGVGDTDNSSTGAGHDHGETPPNPGAFDPSEDIDLSGVPGVTPQQQADAEALLRRTLDRLPQFADMSTLNQRGYYSIGDSSTGSEHFVNWSYLNDDKILDPDFPESVVFQPDELGQPRLTGAMFMLREGTTLDDVPPIGGRLIQWHVHNDLCLTPDPIAPVLAVGDLFVGPDQECTPPNSKRGNVPMMHVWIVTNPCGPFAALEGVAGGQVREGEEVVCTPQHEHAGG